MHNTAHKMKLALASIVMLAMAGCAPIYRNHGYVPSKSDLDAVVIGVDTRDTVAQVFGPPTTEGVMRDEAWYYVASRWQTLGVLAPEELQRDLVAISFDRSGTVRNIEQYSLKDGRVVTLNRRVTDDNIKGASFLQQLLGNIGRLNPNQFIQ